MHVVKMIQRRSRNHVYNYHLDDTELGNDECLNVRVINRNSDQLLPLPHDMCFDIIEEPT